MVMFNSYVKLPEGIYIYTYNYIIIYIYKLYIVFIYIHERLVGFVGKEL